MRLAHLFTVSLLLGFSFSACAEIAAPPTIGVSWNRTAHSTTLPEPFGEIGVLLTNESGMNPKLFVLIRRESLRLLLSDFVDLGKITIESVSYSDPSNTPTGEVEYFEVIASFGDSYKVHNKPCDDKSDFTWERDLAIFRIDREYQISRRTFSFRQMDECG